MLLLKNMLYYSAVKKQLTTGRTITWAKERKMKIIEAWCNVYY